MTDKTKQVVRSAELLLLKATNKRLRACLIRQIYHGDRVLAHLRDGTDWRDSFGRMEMNALAAHVILRELSCAESK